MQQRPLGDTERALPGATLGRGLTFTEEPPAPGQAVELADGLLWMRMPMPGKLEHVNIYALDDGPGWTLIDTGPNTAEAAAIWERLLAGPLGRRPVLRVVLTHHHADHAGRIGPLAAAGASVWATRASWLTLRMLAREPAEEVRTLRAAFLRRLGMAEPLIVPCLDAAAEHDRQSTAAPPGYRRLVEGEVIEMGGRSWRVRLSDGHAPEHASFWSEDGTLAILADQVLPSISAHVGTDPREPEGHTVGQWLEALTRLQRVADDRRLAMAGHERPYRGLSFRLQQMAANHGALLGRLRARLAEGPVCGCDVLALVSADATTPVETALAAAELHAHLLHLCQRNEARLQLDARGVAIFSAGTP